jgi:Domain of unknown function (DUF4386)
VVGVVRLIYIPDALIVHGNAAATANNIAAHELLFRLGIVSNLLASVLFIFVTVALYRLLKGIDQGLAVPMVILGSLMPVPIFFIKSVTDLVAQCSRSSRRSKSWSTDHGRFAVVQWNHPFGNVARTPFTVRATSAGSRMRFAGWGLKNPDIVRRAALAEIAREWPEAAHLS